MVKRKVAKKTVERRFCVINYLTPNNRGRTIKETEREAVEHAKKLIRDEHNYGKSTTLYVVEIVKVVTTGEIPVTVHSIKDWIV